MKTVDIHEATTQLSRLVDKAAAGEAFIITKAGKPLMKVASLEAPRTVQRLGFMRGDITVPDDFDRIGEDELAQEFERQRVCQSVI